MVERSLELGSFTLSSGVRSNYYIDARRVTMSAEGQFLIGKVALEALREEGLNPGWLGGLTLGADPISYAVAHRSWMEGPPVEAFTVRKGERDHGTARRIEGGLPSDACVAVVEDTLTTGGSALEAIAAVEAHGAEVTNVLVLVDREAGGADRIREAGYSLITLFTASELLSEAGAAPSG